MNEKKSVATVDEEPTSSATTRRQINQGNPEETRNTGRRPIKSELGQKQSRGDGRKGK